MYKSEELLKKVNEALDGLTYDRRPSSLYEPIKYVLAIGGKRVRPVLMLLALRARSRRLTLFILPFFILMTLATVYIRAHYLIDVFAGWVSAVLFYAICQTFWTKAKRTY